MKIYFENKYENDDALIEEFTTKIILKNSRRFGLIAVAVGIGFMVLSLVQKNMFAAAIFGISSILFLLIRQFAPKLLIKKIKANNMEITGGGENLFQFGNVIHIEQGNTKVDLEYDMLGSFTELNSSYVFKLGKISYMCLKKNCFTIGDWNGLKAFLLEKNPGLKIK